MVESVKDSTLQGSTVAPGNESINSALKARVQNVDTDNVKIREDELLYLLPEDILFPEDLEVRPWSKLMGLTEDEIEEIDKLAKTIEEEGQIDPIKVRVNKDGKYEAITGGRRTAAIAQINAGKSAKEKPLRVKAIVANEPIKQAHAFRQAAISNIQRKSLSPMDFAACIKTVKENVPGFATPKTLAQYFAVSPATVSQHLKLLELDQDTQIKIHKGEMSRDAAFALIAVPPSKRTEVLAKGQEIQAEKQANKPEPTAVQAPNKTETLKPAPKKIERKTGTVQAKNIKEAIRETPGAETKPQKRSRSEIIAWAEDNQGPAYGYPNGSIHKFFQAFIKWAAGELSDRTLDKYFGEMVSKADKGKPERKEDVKK